jgi:hypothetical protein
MVNRALQFSLSDPKGPTYLMAAREVLEEVCLYLGENTEEDVTHKEITESGPGVS